MVHILQLEDQENLNGDCQQITIRNSAIGGICLGFGASVAGGCSIGNGLVETATIDLARMDCASIDDSWCMDNEWFYLCSSNEKSTTTIRKG